MFLVSIYLLMAALPLLISYDKNKKIQSYTTMIACLTLSIVVALLSMEVLDGMSELNGYLVTVRETIFGVESEYDIMLVVFITTTIYAILYALKMIYWVIINERVEKRKSNE